MWHQLVISSDKETCWMCFCIKKNLIPCFADFSCSQCSRSCLCFKISKVLPFFFAKVRSSAPWKHPRKSLVIHVILWNGVKLWRQHAYQSRQEAAEGETAELERSGGAIIPFICAQSWVSSWDLIKQSFSTEKRRVTDFSLNCQTYCFNYHPHCQWVGSKLFIIRQPWNNGKISLAKVRWQFVLFFESGLNTHKELWRNRWDSYQCTCAWKADPKGNQHWDAVSGGEGVHTRCWGTFSWPDEALICPYMKIFYHIYTNRQTHNMRGIPGVKQSTSLCFHAG